MEILRGARPADDAPRQRPDDDPAAVVEPTDAELGAVCERAFGRDVAVRAARTATGSYHASFRVDLRSGATAYVRFAPPPGRHGAADGDGLRNEHAAAPFLAGLGALVPRLLAADFTHALVGRDWVAHAAVPGLPASEVLPTLDAADRVAFYRGLGTVVRRLHVTTAAASGVGAARFGRVLGPWHARWSDAVAADVAALVADGRRAGVDPGELDRVAAALEAHRAALDGVRRPVLLHGDLWVPNVLVAPGSPRITGVLDHDAASWGDARAEWALHRARLLPDAERAAFEAGYGARPVGGSPHGAGPGEGSPPDEPVGAVAQRDAVYTLRHTLAVRIDIERRGLDTATIPPVHWDLAPRLAALAA